MASELEMALLKRLDEVSDQISVVAITVAELNGVSVLLRDHEQRVKKLEKWQARLIGIYAAGTLLFGIAFRVLMMAIE